MQLGKTSISEHFVQQRKIWQRQALRSTLVLENERLKDKVQLLEYENYDLIRAIKNDKIRIRDGDVASRREQQQNIHKVRLQIQASQRLRIQASAALQQANLRIEVIFYKI